MAALPYTDPPGRASLDFIARGGTVGMTCPHCGVGMWPYETVKKADGTYKRYECRIQYCKTCKGKCTHKELGHRPE